MVVLMQNGPVRRGTAFVGAALLLASSLGGLAGCGNSVTVEQTLETDTYISSVDQGNHADSDTLYVSKSPTREDRVILKLPTGKSDTDEKLDEALGNPMSWAVLPFLVLLETLESLLNCHGSTLNSTNLTAATLDFTVPSTTGLNGQLQLRLLGKPWYQAANWENAHFFSGQGRWAIPGGDVDPSYTFAANTTPDATTVRFDVYTYLKHLLDVSNSVHYGMLISASGSSLSTVSLASVQSASQSSRPRLRSTYTCPTSYNSQVLHTTYYLGGRGHAGVVVSE